MNKYYIVEIEEYEWIDGDYEFIYRLLSHKKGDFIISGDIMKISEENINSGELREYCNDIKLTHLASTYLDFLREITLQEYRELKLKSIF